MKKISELLISTDSSVLNAMEIIDKGSVQIALVVDDDQKLLGTVTDGDIRRGILRGISLDSPVSSVMNRQPRSAKADMDRDAMLSVMQFLNLRQLPIVDESGRVVKLQLLEELIHNQSRDNWIVLMAGGLGTRLGELTKEYPKPLLRVGSTPILELILENFIAQGFHRFYISVNYKAEMIKDYFGDGSRWGVEIRYLHEDKRLGTAGALSLIPEPPESPLIVMNGDLLTKVNFRQLVDFHQEMNAKATMCVREYEWQIPYGVVKVENNRLKKIEEKPTQKYFISGGIYVIEPDLLSIIPYKEYFDMPMLFESMIESNMEPTVFPIREYWIDIGRVDDFEKANAEVYTQGFIAK